MVVEYVYLFNPRPFSAFRHLRQWRGGGGWYDPLLAIGS